MRERRPARGVTLIELLVVIMIMLMISVITIPVVAPALSNRQIRESARMVDVFLNGARNRAAQTGRPVGVVFELNVPGGSTPIVAGTVGGATAYTMPGGSTVLSYAE
ncbi:MAG TPA: prepilin-type N-terminal cleavage/methylation domain-containing protein, partial [Pirellulales bacterium]|nr:prepilin-type N-terminal cleavage/methylation domain-containing protein [Pirellulales bacterium]